MAIAGLPVGIQSLATILTRPYAGRMVDRRGAKATLMRGLAISAGAGLAFQDLAIGLTGPVLGALAAVSSPSSVFLIGAAAAAVGMAVSLTNEPGTSAQA